MPVTMRGLNGDEVSVDQTDITNLKNQVSGRLLQSSDDGYDEARTVWNAMIDRRPGLIVECSSAADAQHAVRFARQHGLLVSIRGAGHNIAGNAVCDGGLMISFASMRSVTVDLDARTVTAQPGVTLGDLDTATQAHGLATPVGINSTTGVAGLTLGGGFGWLSRKHGLTIDNLLGADVVTADGELLRVSDDENQDLFWGIRGGGGNFGIVTSFDFAAHPVGPEVLAGLIVHPFADAGPVLRAWRDFCANAPDEVSVWVVMRKAPPLPFLPEEVHGTEVVVLAVMYAGDVSAGEEALAPLRAHGTPIADVIGPTPFAGFQTAFDPLLAPGVRNYWKSHDFRALTDETLDTMTSFIARLPSPHCEVFLAQMGGATNRVAADATAYPHRDVEFIMNVHGRWDDASDDDRCTAWCRELFDATTPFATGGVYVNFMTEEESSRIEDGAYAGIYDRLGQLKGKYDPDNVFRMNHNIAPLAG